MGAVSNLADFRGRFAGPLPTLVLVDPHVDFPSPGKGEPDRNELSAALEVCRTVLAYARRQGMPVAFVRRMPPLPSFLASHACPPWIRGIEPRRSDMIFERALPSCYASSEFAQMAGRSSELVLAGLFGETACLSTLIEAHHRNHQVTFLADASCSRGHDGIGAGEMHRNVVGLASVYAKLSSAQGWMERLAIRAGMGR